MAKKYGIREICNVVWRACGTYKIGGKTFYEGEPVLYFDSLKTTTLEGAATTVYAQGGRGNARLISWDGEKTLTLTMEDALISLESFQLLAGAQIRSQAKQTHSLIRLGLGKSLVEGTTGVLETTTNNGVETNTGIITLPLGLEAYPNDGDLVYVMAEDDDSFDSEPYLCRYEKAKIEEGKEEPTNGGTITVATASRKKGWKTWNDSGVGVNYNQDDPGRFDETKIAAGKAVYLDFYITDASASQNTIRIEPDSFGYNFYIEGETLFRDTDGRDYPATFTLPKARVQNNFSISMAASGDPGTFSFVLDAFPGYTRCNNAKKCLCEIVISDNAKKASTGTYRTSTSA